MGIVTASVFGCSMIAVTSMAHMQVMTATLLHFQRLDRIQRQHVYVKAFIEA